MWAARVGKELHNSLLEGGNCQDCVNVRVRVCVHVCVLAGEVLEDILAFQTEVDRQTGDPMICTVLRYLRKFYFIYLSF